MICSDTLPCSSASLGAPGTLRLLESLQGIGRLQTVEQSAPTSFAHRRPSSKGRTLTVRKLQTSLVTAAIVIVTSLPGFAIARSTVVRFHNQTSKPLTLSGQGLGYGEWVTHPPNSIGA